MFSTGILNIDAAADDRAEVEPDYPSDDRVGAKFRACHPRDICTTPGADFRHRIQMTGPSSALISS